MLTLKQKLQLFKLAKKPRKQIRLRLELITNELNLPSVHNNKETEQQTQTSSVLKQQNVIDRISHFKKVDNVRHYAHSLSKTLATPRVQVQENKWVKQENNINIKTKQLFYQTKSFSNMKRFYHPNDKPQQLLRSFDFNLTKKEKFLKKQSEKNQPKFIHTTQRVGQVRSEYLSLNTGNNSSNKPNDNNLNNNNISSMKLLGLKNELGLLQNFNQIYKQQLKHAQFIQRLQQNANRLSQFIPTVMDKGGAVTVWRQKK